jgi:hypothetical protein
MPSRRARMRSIRSQNCRRDSGSTPVVGSSRIKRSGSWMSEQHSPSFCRMPPESFFAGRSAKGDRPVLSKRSMMRRSRSVRACPNRRAKNSMFSRTLRSGYRFLPSPCGI